MQIVEIYASEIDENGVVITEPITHTIMHSEGPSVGATLDGLESTFAILDHQTITVTFVPNGVQPLLCNITAI